MSENFLRSRRFAGRGFYEEISSNEDESDFSEEEPENQEIDPVERELMVWV